MIGELVSGRYEVEELLGTGGMSSVFRAHDTVLERRVALKVLHEHYSRDPEYVERFRREARAIAKLSHPNIVTVIDRDEFEGRQFIVFEHVRGETLKDVVERQGPLPVDEALAVAHQVARGLAFAHEHGVVHRDVKPQNVLVDEDGAVKVTDFGIARSRDPDRELTQTGAVMGTSDYISPEQVRGDSVDERSDQYSLGALLYELLTGEPPYGGDHFMAVAMRHLRDPVPSARERRRDVPARVDAIVRRALAKDPADRFPSQEAFMAAVEAALASEAAARPGDDGRTDTLTPVPPVVPAAPRRAREPAPAERRARPRRASPLVPLLLVLLVLAAGAAAIAVLTGRVAVEGPVGAGGDDGGAAAPVRLVAVTDFDPEGGDGEHPEDVPLATDGDPATYWTTETYRSFQKSGVGIVLDTRRRVELGEIDVVTDTPGFTAVVRASNRRRGGFVDVSEEQTVRRRTTFELAGDEPYRFYLVWITDPNGRAHVNEVRAR